MRGASGFGVGSFEEIGPLDTSLNTRNSIWLRKANLLFVKDKIDKPGCLTLCYQQQLGVVAVLLLAVALLCEYELCAVYVTTGSTAPQWYSPSGFFFGVSAIALAIDMLFICIMVFNGNGLDVDEYVRNAYKFAYLDLKSFQLRVYLNHQIQVTYILDSLSRRQVPCSE
ncbi:hypothetical protein OSB04_030343 [Centaurea solstitialis]|uniref:Uncharacterized protein n=1 Tax=Centaurea solstitialis TaxID=347529 RepID=A0AA38SK23_9ASTR|nr:hypothetical protein OSB04_030343 [Centaurea solstitialis]